MLSADIFTQHEIKHPEYTHYLALVPPFVLKYWLDPEVVVMVYGYLVLLKLVEH